MTVCVPIRDLKDTAKFSELVEREGDVIVTKNGYNAFTCFSNEKLQENDYLIACQQLQQRLELAEYERKTGKVVPISELWSSLDEI
jgi:hypothetical protein